MSVGSFLPSRYRPFPAGRRALRPGNVRQPLQLLRPALGEFFKKNLGTAQSDRASLFQSGEGVAGAGDVGRDGRQGERPVGCVPPGQGGASRRYSCAAIIAMSSEYVTDISLQKKYFAKVCA